MAIDPDLLAEFEYLANPVHSPKEHGRLPLDPRLAREFLRSGSLVMEQRQQLAAYVVTAKWTPKERGVYSAILDGWSDIPSISGITGMSEAEVTTTISKLASKGMVRKIAQ